MNCSVTNRKQALDPCPALLDQRPLPNCDSGGKPARDWKLWRISPTTRMNWPVLAENLPHVTATLNLIATCLLAAAFWMIRSGRVKAHRNLMLTALAVSALFLLIYLFHKVALYQATGQTNKKFPTDPDVAPLAARYTYYVMLLSHIVLAISVPVLAIRAVYLAMKGRIVAHKRLVKYAYPIWMYVSVTGVLVYLMLYQIYVPSAG